MSRLSLAILLLVLVPNCDKNIKHESSEAGQKISNKNIALKTDIEKGRIIYYANCVSYHNNNPKKLGSIGPKVYGATIDVLTQKIVSGKYPKNYIPKRKSKIMPIMPHLNKKILTLHAFINTS